MEDPTWADEDAFYRPALARIKRWERTAWPINEADEIDYDTELAELVDKAEVEMQKLSAADGAAYRDWMVTALAGGASAAHRALRDPDPWQPTALVQVRGKLRSDPAALLAGEDKLWGTEWGADPEAVEPWMPDWWGGA